MTSKANCSSRLCPGAVLWRGGVKTEGLQFFANDRHPRWLDVGIDMGGALLGVALTRLLSWAANAAKGIGVSHKHLRRR